MKLKKWGIVILFIVIINILGMYLNLKKFIKASDVTAFNFLVSLIFLILWFILSHFMGMKKNDVYKKFIIIYWYTAFIMYLLFKIGIKTKFDEDILLPFMFWFITPMDGLRYILSNLDIFYYIFAPIGLVVSFTGFTIGEKKIL